MLEKFNETKISGIRYIGSTKFSCDDCYAVISLYNDESFE